MITKDGIRKVHAWISEIEVILDDIVKELGEADNLKRKIEEVEVPSRS